MIETIYKRMIKYGRWVLLVAFVLQAMFVFLDICYQWWTDAKIDIALTLAMIAMWFIVDGLDKVAARTEDPQ